MTVIDNVFCFQIQTKYVQMYFNSIFLRRTCAGELTRHAVSRDVCTNARLYSRLLPDYDFHLLSESRIRNRIVLNTVVSGRLWRRVYNNIIPLYVYTRTRNPPTGGADT